MYGFSGPIGFSGLLENGHLELLKIQLVKEKKIMYIPFIKL